jgi:hypothetical protein
MKCTDWEMEQSWRKWRAEYGDRWQQVATFLVPSGEGSRDLMMVAYVVLSPVSAILVFLDRKQRATDLLRVPAVLSFCALVLPIYMFARRE